jgi:MFS family permease
VRKFWHNNRAILSLAIVSAVAECAYAAVNTLALPIFLHDELKIVAEIGVVGGTFLIVEALCKNPMGALSDRVGRRLVLSIAPFVSALTALAIYCVPGPVTGERIFGFILSPLFFALLALRAIDGLAAAAIWPTMFATMADLVEDHRRTSAMSVLTVSYMVGLGLGPFLAGAATEFIGSKRAPFLVVSVFFMLAGLAAAVLVPKTRRHSYRELEATRDPHAAETPFHWTDLLHSFRTVPLMLLMAFIIFLGIGLLFFVTPLYARAKFGLSEYQLGQLFPVPAVIIGLCALPLGKLGDRWGRANSVHLGLGVAMAAMWGIVLSRGSEWFLVAGATFLGLGFVIGLPAWIASVADRAGEARRAEVIGAVGTAEGIGAFLGGLLGPKLYHWHFEAPVITSAAFLSLGFLLSFLTVQAHARRQLSDADLQAEEPAGRH